MTKPTVGELFAGIGGFGLGFERAGFEVKWANEIDPYACKVYAKNFPHVELIQEDIRVWEPEERHKVDVLTGGFPCQDISSAKTTGGPRANLSGSKSGLWKEMARVVRLLHPRIVVVENVQALRRVGLGEVLGDLATLGYDAEWCSLSACSLGFPHMRKRVFIVAYPYGSIQSVSTQHEKTQELPTFTGFVGENGWEAPPEALGMANGLSSRMDRLIGNAVVPQVAEVVARAVKPFLADS